MIALTGGGIDREHHTRACGRDLALDHNRDIHVALTESPLTAVVDRPRPEQRLPAALHRIDHRLTAAHVQERLIHSCERRRRGVLRRRRRSHRHRDIRLTVAEILVRGTDRVRQPDRHLAVTNRLTSGLRRRLQRRGVLYVKVPEHVLESLGESGLHPERGVSRGTDDESRRDRQARSSQLPEVRALATGIGHVGSRKVRKRPDRDEVRRSNGGIVRDGGHRREPTPH